MLLTVLGEFVLPSEGGAWTSTLVIAAGELGIGEKNARQALSRIGEQGLIATTRHGRRARCELTAAGRELLEAGAQRIYGFGVTGDSWRGDWLVAHCPVAETQRALRNELRTRLGFLGFGELSPSLLVSPHVDREGQLHDVLDQLGLLAESVVFRSTALTPDANVVERAWQLDAVADAYRSFAETVESVKPSDPAETFRAVVELVHDWRRFPSVDPELPRSLLPTPWVGTEAATLFHDRHRDWSPAARRWFSGLG